MKPENHSYQFLITKDLMRFLKIEAANAGVTIKDFILSAIREKAERENKEMPNG